MPRWRGLYHFDHVFEMKFNDGSKEEDLSKVRFTFADILFLRDSLNLVDYCFH